jgi:mRNA interferase HigB
MILPASLLIPDHSGSSSPIHLRYRVIVYLREQVSSRFRDYEPSFTEIVIQTLLIPYWDRASVVLMRIVSRSTLRAYVETYSGSSQYAPLLGAVESWIAEVSRANWQSTADVKRSYRSASVINAERIVFNIKGNDHRLVVSIDYSRGIVFIKWIGTHREYNGLNVREVQFDG